MSFGLPTPNVRIHFKMFKLPHLHSFTIVGVCWSPKITSLPTHFPCCKIKYVYECDGKLRKANSCATHIMNVICRNSHSRPFLASFKKIQICLKGFSFSLPLIRRIVMVELGKESFNTCSQVFIVAWTRVLGVAVVGIS